jgi:hypothetical protein
MSYEQLVSILKTQITLKGYESFQDRALLTIVELHKPDEWDDCSFCTGVRDTYFYPCPTIKAIEKELKKI